MDRSFVVLASTAYAGSTLLSFLLGAHPGIATTSDVSGARREGRMDEFECSCRKRMVDCEFWTAVVAGMRQRGFADFELRNFRLGFDYLGVGWRSRALVGALPIPALEPVRDALVSAIPGHRARMRAIAERNRAFADVVMDLAGARAFVDASKERMRPLHLHQLLGPVMDVRVIHLVRDVRGVVESAIRRAKKPGLTPESAARNWAATNAIILRNLEQVPKDRAMTVRYEDLCHDPDGTLARVFAFCRVDPSIRLDDVAATEQHLLGNRMRLAGVDEIRLDERWRSALRGDDLVAIGRTAGSVHARLYPDGEPLAASAAG
jgi:sulfotransferase family protein